MSTATLFRPQPSRAAPSAPSYLPKKKTMSITQTYYLAHKARAKLSHEAARSDHNLRLLVGHANLLDSLMLELADAEREQESWFNQSVRGATKQEERHVQWAESIIEDPEEDWRAEDAGSDSSDSDDDFEEESDDVEMVDALSIRRVPATKIPSIRIEEHEYDEMDEDDLEEDYAHLELVRTPSHSSPPELDHDEDSSDDEAMPPSPPTDVLAFNEKDSKEEDLSQQQESFYSEGFYLPPRNPARLVSAISVY